MPKTCETAAMLILALHLVPQAMHIMTTRRLVHRPCLLAGEAVVPQTPQETHLHVHVCDAHIGSASCSPCTVFTCNSYVLHPFPCVRHVPSPLPRLAFLHQPHTFRILPFPALVAAQVSKRRTFVDVDVRRP